MIPARARSSSILLQLPWYFHFISIWILQGGVPAFIGFNAGNGTKSYAYMPYSQVFFKSVMISMQNSLLQTTYVRDLPYTGMANGFPGRHVFRIDEKILPGVCIRCWLNIFNIRYSVWPSICFCNYRILKGPDRGQFAAGVRPREREHAGGHHGQPDRALLWARYEGDLQVWWWET